MYFLKDSVTNCTQVCYSLKMSLSYLRDLGVICEMEMLAKVYPYRL